MQEFLAALNEVREQLLGRAFQAPAFLFGSLSNGVLHFCLFINWEDVGDFTSVQDVVNIF